MSGNKLAFSAFQQAYSFGATFLMGCRATGLQVDGTDRVVRLSDGSSVRTAAAIIATGAEYRRLGVPPSRADRPWCLLRRGGVRGGRHERQAVCVVGGGNSAGQAAVHLARYASLVTVLVRGPSLASGMSEYLIRALDRAPNISVLYNVEIVDSRGEERLEQLVVQDLESGKQEQVATDGRFVLIGSQPQTDWLTDVLAHDQWGFICTAQDIPDGTGGLERARYPMETSAPGVFAVGDVRHASVKRVGSSVGAGAIAIQYVHRYLDEVKPAGLAPA